MHIVDLDKDPRLTNFHYHADGQVYAGHFIEIKGTNYDPTSPTNPQVNNADKRVYRSKNDIMSAHHNGSLVTIWINTPDPLGDNNKSFSIKISDNDVKSEFLRKYEDVLDYIENPTNIRKIFIVCDDALVSHNPETNNKKFYPIDSIEQLENEFHIWRPQ